MDAPVRAEPFGNEGFRPRGKLNKRPATDYAATMARWLQHKRSCDRVDSTFSAERPNIDSIIDMLPPIARKGRPADTIPAKHLHTSFNKVRHYINVVKWTPEGRRVLTGASSGEFTLWNGVSFNFETIMQAHDTAVRSVAWSHTDDWLISAEQSGVVKYWQPNFNNVKSIQAHEESIQDLAFAPTDSKFVTASVDHTLKIYDFAAGQEELRIDAHEWDAKTVDWHPTKGLIVSGSKDHNVKLWDPRTGRCLTTLRGHKTSVNKTIFEPTNGVLLASCARDQLGRVFDIRMMRDIFHLKVSQKDISTLTWHPFHANLITAGSTEGAINHFLLDEQNQPHGVASTISVYDQPTTADPLAQIIYPVHTIGSAHDKAIWSMDWHPLGHIMTSGSNDCATRFWSRPRPGDDTYMNDRYHIGSAAAEAQESWNARERTTREEIEREAEDEADGLVDQAMPSRQNGLPGLPGLPGLSAVQGPPASTAPLPETDYGDPAFPDFLPPGGGPPLPFMLPPGQNGMPPPLPPGMDIETLKNMFGGQLPMPPMPVPGQGFPPPSFPGFPGGLPTPGPPGPPMPMPMPMPVFGAPGMPGHTDGPRRRGPLPSQQESLAEQMRQGNYLRPR